MRIEFMTEDALVKLRADLQDNVGHYVANDQSYFYDVLERIRGLRRSSITCHDFDLDMSAALPEETDATNVRRLYGAMRSLSPVVASDERLWTGLSHGYFWDYVQYRQRSAIATKKPERIGSSFFFTNGHRRSLYVHCLSRLWWAGYMTYDAQARDPFALTDVLTKHAFASTVMLFSSSNMTSNRDICLGVLGAIKKRQDMGEKIERKHFVGSLRYLNNMGALTVLDMLSREDIEEIVGRYLASDAFAGLKLKTKEGA